MEYKIIEHHDVAMFVGLVNEAIEEGWKLHGSVAIATVAYGGDFYTLRAQSMVRDEDEDEESIALSLTDMATLDAIPKDIVLDVLEEFAASRNAKKRKREGVAAAN